MSEPRFPEEETRSYGGSERRDYPRIPASYPICIRFTSPSGKMIERFAQTRDVAAKGVFFACAEAPETGTEVEVLMGIPSVHAASLPAAQLEGWAVVVRRDPIHPTDNEGFGVRVALKFLKKPCLTTKISMFD